MKTKLLILYVFFISALCAETYATRAAIDIGMGGPKLQVAVVNLETNKIVKVLYTQRYFVNFYENLKNDDQRLSPEVMMQGLESVKEAIQAAKIFKVEGIAAIATASFRQAVNGVEFANVIENETGIKVHIVDQILEGRLAFEAVLLKVDIEPENLVVWDIGGGSIQFTTLGTDGSFLVDCGSRGVGAFNDHIIGHIQGQSIIECKTPNPMSMVDIIHAENYARNQSQNVDESFKEKLKRPTTKVIGAGNAFGYGIAFMVGSSFCLDDIAAVVYGLAGKTDEDFGGDYAFCEGSNTILAFGFMKGLDIKQVQVVNINNADGSLFYKPFWEK